MAVKSFLAEEKKEEKGLLLAQQVKVSGLNNRLSSKTTKKRSERTVEKKSEIHSFLKIRHFSGTEQCLHFILRRTQANAVTRNLIKRIVREELNDYDYSGKIVIGLIPAKVNVERDKIVQFVRKEIRLWLKAGGFKKND